MLMMSVVSSVRPSSYSYWRRLPITYAATRSHSNWTQIKGKKAVLDLQKGQARTKLLAGITKAAKGMAVRAGERG